MIKAEAPINHGHRPRVSTQVSGDIRGTTRRIRRSRIRNCSERRGGRLSRSGSFAAFHGPQFKVSGTDAQATAKTPPGVCCPVSVVRCLVVRCLLTKASLWAIPAALGKTRIITGPEFQGQPRAACLAVHHAVRQHKPDDVMELPRSSPGGRGSPHGLCLTPDHG